MTQELLYITAPILSAIIPLAVFLCAMELSRNEGGTVSKLKGQKAFGICGICTALILVIWAGFLGEFAITLMGIALLMFYFSMAVISDALLDVARMDPAMLVGGKCRGVNIPATGVYTGAGRTNPSKGGFRPLRTPETPSKPLFGTKP